jgi:hypothetical protein
MSRNCSMRTRRGLRLAAGQRPQDVARLVITLLCGAFSLEVLRTNQPDFPATAVAK